MSVLKAIRHVGASLIENPRLAPLVLKQVGKHLNHYYFDYRGPPDSVDLMSEDWDTAILLDACRYDVFAEERTLEGDLSKAISPATNSHGFISETFKGETYHDTVYVTGNPFTTILEDNIFHDVKLDEAWDGRNEEAPPERITAAAIDAHREHPDKRVYI